MSKLRVWWVPQVPMKSFNVPVKTPEEAKQILDILAAYDMFQYENHVKGDYSNMGGLEVFNEEEKDWEDWYSDDGLDIYEYIEECSRAGELNEFAKELWEQIDRSKLK